MTIGGGTSMEVWDGVQVQAPSVLQCYHIETFKEGVKYAVTTLHVSQVKGVWTRGNVVDLREIRGSRNRRRLECLLKGYKFIIIDLRHWMPPTWRKLMYMSECICIWHGVLATTVSMALGGLVGVFLIDQGVGPITWHCLPGVLRACTILGSQYTSRWAKFDSKVG